MRELLHKQVLPMMNVILGIMNLGFAIQFNHFWVFNLVAGASSVSIGLFILIDNKEV